MQIIATLTINIKKPMTKKELQKRIDETAPLDVTDQEVYSVSTENYVVVE